MWIVDCGTFQGRCMECGGGSNGLSARGRMCRGLRCRVRRAGCGTADGRRHKMYAGGLLGRNRPSSTAQCIDPATMDTPLHKCYRKSCIASVSTSPPPPLPQAAVPGPGQAAGRPRLRRLRAAPGGRALPAVPGAAHAGQRAGGGGADQGGAKVRRGRGRGGKERKARRCRAG